MQRWHPVPPAVYSLVEQTAGSVLLESGPNAEPGAQSQLFLKPSQILTALSPEQLDLVLAQVEAAVRSGTYAVGYFGYECGAWAEPASRPRMPEPRQPIAWIGLYDQSFVFDHQLGVFTGSAPAELNRFVAPEVSVTDGIEVAAGLDEVEYGLRIEIIHDAIRTGDVYQLNLTFPLQFTAAERPASLYARLRRSQSAPYGAFVNLDEGRCVLSFSPELFFRIEEDADGRRIVTKPMKGTAPRGRTNAEDRAQAEWLTNDAKNRAENVMIVDLLRNDLGRVCRFGSVEVPELFKVTRHETLWQMTSTVSGKLHEDLTCADILRALFPSGSVTGAPKVRAMQLLADLEGSPRGVYTGAIGYFGPHGAEFNVAIRTLELDRGQVRMSVGSGIVIDSNAHDEYCECLLKAQFLTRQQFEFELIETLRWDGGYPLLELHLDRLCDSAEYFGFTCEPTGVQNSLLQLAASFPPDEMRKVRLLLNREGTLHLFHEVLTAADLAEPVRLCVSTERTNANDRFLFHKTTHRLIYATGFAAARAAGYDDALFLNTDGQVTETAIGNIFIVRDGKWFTPPIECGLLAGVYRRKLLGERREIEERRLTLEDVKTADCVYVCNAVRGLRRAIVE